MVDVPTYSLRPDPELDAALDYLGATPGNRSKIMREAIITHAAHRRRADSEDFPAAVSRELDVLKASLDKLRAVLG